MEDSYYVEPNSFLLQHLHLAKSLGEDTAMRWTKKLARFGSFMIYARGLYVANGDDSRYFKWTKLRGKPCIELVEAVEVSYLHVSGSIRMSYLTPGQKYAVMFVIKLRDEAYAKTAANLHLTLPDGTKKSRVVDVGALGREHWVNLKAGSFTATYEDGMVEFSLWDPSEGIKSGIRIAGVLIQPRF